MITLARARFDEIQTRLGERVRVRWDTELSERLKSKFPITLGRIDWRWVPGHIYLAPPSEGKLSASDPELVSQLSDYHLVVLAFFDENLAKAERADSWVAYVGDSMTEEYEVNRSGLLAFIQIVASVADHKYVFALDASWCLMWSMECQLYFGLAPARLPRRRVDDHAE